MKGLAKLALAIGLCLFLLYKAHIQLNPFALSHFLANEFASHRINYDTDPTLRSGRKGIIHRFSIYFDNEQIIERVTAVGDETVYFVTERRQILGSTPLFLNERDPGGQIIYGEITIKVPAFSYEYTDKSRPDADISMPAELKLPKVHILSRAEFYSSIFSASPQSTGAQVRQFFLRPMIYVHGFNNGFSEELWRAAKLKRDAGIAGPVVIFDWPSGAELGGYLPDRNAVENSVDDLANFIEDFYSQCSACRLNLLAHSLGSRMLIRSLRVLTYRNSPAKVESVIFAAPDVDTLFFESQLKVIESSGLLKQVVIYGSANDNALYESKRRNKYDPVGLFPAHTFVPNMFSVDVSHVPQSSVGHDYFVSSIEVETDIGLILRGSLASRAAVSDGDDPRMSRLIIRKFKDRTKKP